MAVTADATLLTASSWHGRRRRARHRGRGYPSWSVWACSHQPSTLSAGGDSVTFHVEACDDPSRAIAGVRTLGLGVGLAFNPETSVEEAAAAADGADLVLCMSIHPGYSGQEFMPEAFGRIERLRSLLPEGVRVQVDGGIHGETIRSARDAGADLLVAGSAIFWRDDPAAGYLELVAAVGDDH